MSTNLILALIVAALQVADAVTTIRNLRRPGGKEHNPLIRGLIERFGMVPALVGKGVVLSAACILAALYVPGREIAYSLVLLIGVYLVVVVSNIERGK